MGKNQVLHIVGRIVLKDGQILRIILFFLITFLILLKRPLKRSLSCYTNKQLRSVYRFSEKPVCVKAKLFKELLLYIIDFREMSDMEIQLRWEDGQQKKVVTIN